MDNDTIARLLILFLQENYYVVNGVDDHVLMVEIVEEHKISGILTDNLFDDPPSLFDKMKARREEKIRSKSVFFIREMLEGIAFETTDCDNDIISRLMEGFGSNSSGNILHISDHLTQFSEMITMKRQLLSIASQLTLSESSSSCSSSSCSSSSGSSSSCSSSSCSSSSESLLDFKNLPDEEKIKILANSLESAAHLKHSDINARFVLQIHSETISGMIDAWNHLDENICGTCYLVVLTPETSTKCNTCEGRVCNSCKDHIKERNNSCAYCRVANAYN